MRVSSILFALLLFVGMPTYGQSISGPGGAPTPVAPAPSPSTSIGITPGVAGSSASSAILKAAPGNLYGVYANAGSTPVWLAVFNRTTAPSNGAATAGIASGNYQDCIGPVSNGPLSINYSPGPPEIFTVGIVAVLSSTECSSITLSATGFIHGSAQ